MAKWLRLMRRDVPRSSFCRRSKWRDENRPFISTLSTFFSSTAKVSFRCRWRHGRTFWRNYVRAQATPGFDTPARSVEMPASFSRKCNAAAWRGSLENYAARFTNPAGEAALGLNSNVLPNRNSSLADSLRRKGHANISARCWSVTTKIAIWYSPVRSEPDLQQNHWLHFTRNSVPRNVPIVRLSICHQSRTANGCWASRHQ